MSVVFIWKKVPVMRRSHQAMSVFLLGTLLSYSSPTLGRSTSSSHRSRAASVTNVGISGHRIGVRIVNGTGEFYDRVTGAKFTPRGNNYIRLAPQTIPFGGSITYHSTFNPGRYDPAEAETALERMHGDGYNVVRVFLNQISLADPSGLSSAYLTNVVDYLKRAKANQVYVILTADDLPWPKYGQILNQDCCDLFAADNLRYLAPSGLTANRLYFQDLVRTLIALGAPLDAIFSYELRNELFFAPTYPPLSLTSGRVQTANGQTYDMAVPQDRQRMIDENLPFWIDQMRAVILQDDPTALVTVGFFQPSGPNPLGFHPPGLSFTYPAIWLSHADFIDLHAYLGLPLNLKQLVENFQINGMREKPIIMGEFGAAASAFPTIDKAARAFTAWQAESGQYGFSGWLLWSWDPKGQADFYDALSGDGEIERALSPVVRPDPGVADAPGVFETNLARGSKVTASHSLQSAAYAVDGTPTPWNAGAGPPQWIQIDLGKPSAIRTIRLTVAQSPAGKTTHQIWVGTPSDPLHLVQEFTGNTQDGDVLEYKPDGGLVDVQYVRVVTTKSPSWVAWKEIEVISP